MAEPALAIEPPLVRRGGRYVDPRGHNAPVHPHTPKRVATDDGDEDPTEVDDLPVSDSTWAEIISIHKWRDDPPNKLPELLPNWVTPELQLFLETAQLSAERMRGMLRSRDTFARRVREYAEEQVSVVNAKGVQKKRTIGFDLAQRLLLGLLPLANRAQGVSRTFVDSIRVRIVDLKRDQLRKTTVQREQMIELYRLMLRHGLPLNERDLYGDDLALSPKDRARRREIEEMFAAEARPQQATRPTNPNYPNQRLWDPPTQSSPVSHIYSRNRDAVYSMVVPAWHKPAMSTVPIRVEGNVFSHVPNI